MSLLREGQTISNKWLVERMIGEGAFAEVYRVRHRIFGRQAMKVFKRTGMELSEVEDILQEPMLLAQINHPNIIRVFDADTTETSQGICCFFTMEYVAGGTLERFWKSYGDQFVPVNTTVELLKQVASGLSLAHSNAPPIVHRDIKPQNILVGYDGEGLRVRIADFGLAKEFNILTMELTGLGTRLFKPPEVLADLKSDSRAGDIWAIGTCFYMLLTDHFPYIDDFDLEDTSESRFHRPLVVPSRLNAYVDEGLDKIVSKCLSRDAEDRYQTANDLFEDLDTWYPKKNNRKEASYPIEHTEQKSVFGHQSIPNEKVARDMAVKALELSRSVCTLSDAADLMEEAFNRWPSLRSEYEYKLLIWRKGISG